jgi:hemerythrin
VQTIKWSPESNSVYLPDIDEEHKSLFQMTDEIHQALQADARMEAVEPKIHELLLHAAEHFAHEEKMMKSLRYPGYVWHKGQHNVVRTKAAMLDQATQHGDREAVLFLLDFLAAWLQTHTAVSDRMMGAYLRNRRKHR